MSSPVYARPNSDKATEFQGRNAKLRTRLILWLPNSVPYPPRESVAGVAVDWPLRWPLYFDE